MSNGERGVDFDQFCNEVRSINRGMLWRHNQAGDLSHTNGIIDERKLHKLTSANNGRRGFTYTHHELNEINLNAIRKANANGFTVNISLNSVDEIKHVKHLELPMVVVLPLDAPNVQTIDGVKVVACPAEKTKKVQCANCAICYDAKRNYAIGFRAHGTQKNFVNIIAKG